jgi:hypothetical protein
VIAILGFPLISIGIVEERAQVAVGAHAYVSAAAAVTTIGAAQRDELFAPKGDHAGTAIAGFHADDYTIDEHSVEGA